MPFDLEQFKNAQITVAMDTSFTPPKEDTYRAVVEDFNVTEVEGKQTHNQGQIYHFLEVVWVLEDPQGKLKEYTGQDKVRATQKLTLDMEKFKLPDGKDGWRLLAGKGKNIALGALREALGQNQAGKPWALTMLKGGKATVQTGIEKFARKDGGDGQKAIVKYVAPYTAPMGGASAASAMPKAAGAR